MYYEHWTHKQNYFYVKSVFFYWIDNIILLAKFACANLTLKSFDANLLNARGVIYLSWSVVTLFSISLIFVLQWVFLN